ISSPTLIDEEPTKRKTQKAVHETMGDSSGLACIRQSLSKLYRFLYIIESKCFCQRFLSGY
ncbi:MULTISPECIES: hypothetical protein, partial [unclassified Enterococcus]|uniref:hypothetical protein n=1 Tax=unclassified Enterococcus TaxID=2608891 RepID=UPI001C40A99C